MVLWPEPRSSDDPWRRIRQIMEATGKETSETSGFRIVQHYEEMIQARQDGVFHAFLGLEGMVGLDSHPDRRRAAE